tara:strand:+ start:242 stop:2458 length:2217 start_codon:yes stop_codon:yes gene_type:complete
MPQEIYTVSEVQFENFQGDVIPPGTVELVITPNNGYQINVLEFAIGGATNNFDGGSLYTGGQVSDEIQTVEFIANGDGTVSAIITHGQITVVDNQPNLKIDIDHKPIAQTIVGCTNPAAENYNINATQDDNSCLFVEVPEPIPGCTNPNALNYAEEATVDDGSCDFYLEPVVDDFYGYRPNLMVYMVGGRSAGYNATPQNPNEIPNANQYTDEDKFTIQFGGTCYIEGGFGAGGSNFPGSENNSTALLASWGAGINNQPIEQYDLYQFPDFDPGFGPGGQLDQDNDIVVNSIQNRRATGTYNNGYDIPIDNNPWEEEQQLFSVRYTAKEDYIFEPDIKLKTFNYDTPVPNNCWTSEVCEENFDANGDLRAFTVRYLFKQVLSDLDAASIADSQFSLGDTGDVLQSAMSQGAHTGNLKETYPAVDNASEAYGGGVISFIRTPRLLLKGNPEGTAKTYSVKSIKIPTSISNSGSPKSFEIKIQADTQAKYYLRVQSSDGRYLNTKNLFEEHDKIEVDTTVARKSSSSSSSTWVVGPTDAIATGSNIVSVPMISVDYDGDGTLLSEPVSKSYDVWLEPVDGTYISPNISQKGLNVISQQSNVSFSLEFVNTNADVTLSSTIGADLSLEPNKKSKSAEYYTYKNFIKFKASTVVSSGKTRFSSGSYSFEKSDIIEVYEVVDGVELPLDRELAVDEHSIVGRLTVNESGLLTSNISGDVQIGETTNKNIKVKINLDKVLTIGS